MIRSLQSLRGTSTTSTHRVVLHPNSGARILIADPVREWRDVILGRLNDLCGLEPGWDGYRGMPVSFENANFAFRMLEASCPSEAPTPAIVPGPAGDLQLEWHTPKGDIELHVRAPHDVHAWRATEATGPDGEEMELTNDFTIIAGWIKELGEPVSALEAAAA